MPALSDCRFEALRAQTSGGATNDMLVEWLQLNGATSNSLPDAWEEMLETQGFPYGSRNDSWYALLGSLGYTQGSLNDRELDFWCNGGGIIGPYDGVTITDHPDNLTVNEDDPSSFTVVATSGNASALSYQWQYRVPGTSDWLNLTDNASVTGSTTATVTLDPSLWPDNDLSGWRCVVTNSFNSRNSNAATLTVLEAVRFVNGPITPYDAVVGEPVVRESAPFFEGEIVPFVYSLSGTAWPAWASIDPATGQVTGTPDGVLSSSGHSVTATDNALNTAVSNTFTIEVAASTQAISFSGTIPDIAGTINQPITPIPTAIYFSGTEGPFEFTESPGGSAWPNGIDIDINTGVISGTPTADGVISGLQVRGTDQLLNTAESNAFDSNISEANPPIFNLPLTHNLVPAFSAGSPTPNFTRNSEATCFDYQGNLVTVAAGVPRFQGARLDVDGVTWHDTQADGTTPIAESTLYGYVSENASTNEALWNRDFTKTEWVSTGIAPTLDAQGIDGAANSASTLTATSPNGTCFQVVTGASSERTVSFEVRRKTGTGFIGITMNGGLSYLPIQGLINNSTYTRVQLTSSVSNPGIGFNILTSGDAIEVDYGQLEGRPFATSHIKTESSPVARVTDALTYDDAGNFNDTAGFWEARVATFWPESAGGYAFSRGNGGRVSYTATGEESTRSRSYDGINLSIVSSAPDMYLSSIRLTTAWGAGLICTQGGTDGSAKAYTGTFGSGGLGVGMRFGQPTLKLDGTIKNVLIYDVEEP